jgi:hypothetical protein
MQVPAEQFRIDPQSSSSATTLLGRDRVRNEAAGDILTTRRRNTTPRHALGCFLGQRKKNKKR